MTLNEHKLTVARAAKRYRANPADASAKAEYEAAREAFIVAKAERRVIDCLAGAQLSLASRHRIIDAVLTSS